MQAQIAALLECFAQHPHFVITSHARPDGDAIGSVLALAELLHQLGRTTDLVLADPIPAIYRTLPGVDRIRQAAALDLADSPTATRPSSSSSATASPAPASAASTTAS